MGARCLGKTAMYLNGDAGGAGNYQLEESFIRVVEQIAGSEKGTFQHGKNSHEIIVDAQQDSVLWAPLIRGYANLQSLVHSTRDADEIAQHQNVKRDPEHDPEQRSNTFKEAAQPVVAAAQGKMSECQQHQIKQKTFCGSEVEEEIS